MIGDWGFVVWIVLIGIPIGLGLVTIWSRSRGAGQLVDEDDAEVLKSRRDLE